MKTMQQRREERRQSQLAGTLVVRMTPEERATFPPRRCAKRSPSWSW
jgi:hypothetical protein